MKQNVGRCQAEGHTINQQGAGVGDQRDPLWGIMVKVMIKRRWIHSRSSVTNIFLFPYRTLQWWLHVSNLGLVTAEFW